MVKVKLNGHAKGWIAIGLVILGLFVGWSAKGATMAKGIEVNKENIQALKLDVKDDIGILQKDIDIIKADVKELLKRK